MKCAIRVAVLGSFLLFGPAMQAEETSVLKEVSTSIVGGHCRIVFAFGGDVRFSTEQGKNALRIIFSRTRAGSVQTLAKRILNTGPVESIAFQRPAFDSIIATLTFVGGSTYRCVCPASGTELFVDVKGSAAVRQSVVAAKPPKTQPAHQAVPESPIQEPVQTASASSLIDIPGVARRQVEQENADDARHTSGAATSVSDSPAMPVVLMSVLLSLSVTGLVLVLVTRAMRSRRPSSVVAAPLPQPPVQPAQVARTFAVYEEYDDMKPEPDRVRALFSAPRREEEPEEDFGRETSLQLARTFRRGSEEITLARKFHEHPTSSASPAKMQTAMSRATTKTQRLNAARKLGMGRGEFDLADKLKAMSQTPVKKEEQA